MIMPSTGFSHGVVHFWHMCQKIFVPISLVCQRCPVLVLYLNVIYLKWCRLTALMPPKKFWHTCVRTFLACFCVSEILTHRPQKQICHFFWWHSRPLSLSTFSVSLHLRVACAVATFLRTPRTSHLLWCLPSPSRQPYCNFPSLSRTHLSPLLQAESLWMMLRFFKPTKPSSPSPLEVVADSLIHGPSSGLCVQGEHEDIELRDKKRKKSAQATFAYQIKNLTGLDIVPAEDKMGEGAVFARHVAPSHFEIRLRDGKAMPKVAADWRQREPPCRQQHGGSLCSVRQEGRGTFRSSATDILWRSGSTNTSYLLRWGRRSLR